MSGDTDNRRWAAPITVEPNLIPPLEDPGKLRMVTARARCPIRERWRAGVGYQDAVQLLGGDTGRVVRLLDTLTGAGLITLLGPVPGVLGWLDAKTELSKS
ncbi:hypothetical protein [Micromonospora sp. NPDC048947]|uniref:NACHT N-terminal helical domain 7-containing protein n=1 Tax=Micromonospora sp. NPDC048947 TaxID=3154826 RepID=UPI0033C99D4A